MESKILFKRPSFIFSVLGILFLSILIMTLGVSPSEGSYTTLRTSLQNTVLKIQKIAIPVRLSIPALKVDAPIKSLGLTPQGTMAATKGAFDVAWFKLGPRPGEQGSAVIAGHYGIFKNGDVSVFNKLHTLRKGDTVSVKDSKGIITTFVVRESKTYALDADASDVFGSTDNKSHLNLVTCVYNPVTKKYPKRLVVFTDKLIQ